MAENKHSIPRMISLIYRTGHIYIGKQLKEYNIGKGQYIFLNALYKKDNISQEELSSYLRIDKGTTAKALKKLEEEGLIERTADDKDRRANKVCLTEKAKLIRQDVRTVLHDWKNVLLTDFTEEEEELAFKILEKMCDNAENHVINDLNSEI